MKKPLGALLLCFSSALSASSMQKCVAANGSITFTQHGCATTSTSENIVVTQASGGLSLTDPLVPYMPEPIRQSRTGEDQGSCKYFTSQQIRTMIVREQIAIGMKASDVARSWGRPFKVNRSSHGNAQWVYDGQYVYIDNYGCVASWN